MAKVIKSLRIRWGTPIFKSALAQTKKIARIRKQNWRW